MSLLTQIFTWWNGATIGTKIFTSRHGIHVGTDEQGNRYYKSKPTTKTGRTDITERRWVIYNGTAEASRIAVDWHSWMHHVVDETPTEEDYVAREWQKEHKANLTGTSGAYRPDGSILGDGTRKPVSGDYEAWRPE